MSHKHLHVLEAIFREPVSSNIQFRTDWPEPSGTKLPPSSALVRTLASAPRPANASRRAG